MNKTRILSVCVFFFHISQLLKRRPKNLANPRDGCKTINALYYTTSSESTLTTTVTHLG